MLRDWEPFAQYTTDENDIAAEFYAPCMRDAIRYDRITGYFSSAVYLIVWDEIANFAVRGGQMRVICSPSLSLDDASSIEAGYRARTDPELAEALLVDFYRMLNAAHLADPARALAGMVVDGIIDFRIAQVSPSAKASTRSMFHDKTGLFYDDAGDVVGFRGGMNETYLGLAVGGNVDSIDVWTSWAGGRETDRVVAAIDRFERLWAGSVPGIDVRPVPEIALVELARVASESQQWQLIAEAIAAHSHSSPEAGPKGRELYAHQQRALDAWIANGRIGMLDHATGAGKTFTAVAAIREALDSGYRPLVLVPSALLLEQWTHEIKSELSDMGVRVHPCGGGHTEWRDLLSAWLAPTEANRVIVATIATASDPKFIGQLSRAAGRLLVVADEAHRLGAVGAQRLLEVQATSRLGLSATPERAGDPEGTNAVMGYFDRVVDRFSIQDALNAKILTPYNYEPHVVRLDHGEQEQFDELSARISRAAARFGRGEEGQVSFNHPALRLLLIRRARIIKKARSKISCAHTILSGQFRSGDRWLVYCEDQDQLRDVVATLIGAGLPVTEYHSAMVGDRSATMANFANNGGVLVSISCLDEGVDVPAASHALILASSRNPREFIQRRGRVLRRSPDKAYATIHDAIVVPSPPLETSARSLILGELARAIEFADHAFTSHSRAVLVQAFIDAGGDLADPDVRGGFEPDDDEI